jgi:uncharacterized protein
MKTLITGSTGLVGSALIPSLIKSGHSVSRMVRSQSSAGSSDVNWDPLAGKLDKAKLEGFESVVHLAGENIASGRWTEERKNLIRDSRVKGTRLLCESLAGMERPPKVLVCASAIGYYGDRGDEILTEESKPGTDFLSKVCVEWEAAAQPAIEKGIRVAYLRIGVIMSAAGGALAKMLLPFKMGVGGKLGSGKQYMSWITLDDVTGIIRYTLDNENVKGPINTVAPNPVTNLEFTKTLGKVLSRPTIFAVPAFGARIAFGEMADALLLSSTRVKPARLLALGYSFQHPDLETGLRHVMENYSTKQAAVAAN